MASLARRIRSDENGLLGALEPIDLFIELGDPLLALGQGHGVFAMRPISRSTSTLACCGSAMRIIEVFKADELALGPRAAQGLRPRYAGRLDFLPDFGAGRREFRPAK
jgi:hypothetical protein